MATKKTTPKKSTTKKPSLVKRVVAKITKPKAKPVVAEKVITKEVVKEVSQAETPATALDKFYEYAEKNNEITAEKLHELGYSVFIPTIYNINMYLGKITLRYDVATEKIQIVK